MGKMKTSEEIYQVASEIEAVLKENPVAAPNDFAPQRIRFLAGQLVCDNYASSKAMKIASLSEIFYSARKHKTHTGGSQALWAEMTCDLLKRMRDQAATRADGGD